MIIFTCSIHNYTSTASPCLWCSQEVVSPRQQLTKLTEDNRVLREALEFYGKPHNYSAIGDFKDGEIVSVQAPAVTLDEGKIAREALAKTAREGEEK